MPFGADKLIADWFVGICDSLPIVSTHSSENDKVLLLSVVVLSIPATYASRTEAVSECFILIEVCALMQGSLDSGR